MVLVACGTIGPCDDFNEIIEWGEDNLPFLWRLLPYRQGIAGSPQALAEAVRSHWAIGNSLRRVLNVAFGRDKARSHAGQGPANMAIVRHCACERSTTIKASSSAETRPHEARTHDPVNPGFIVVAIPNRTLPVIANRRRLSPGARVTG